MAAQLVVGADAELVAKVLGEAGDEDVLVLDGPAASSACSAPCQTRACGA